MDLAATLSTFSKSSWNPARTTGTELPPVLLLMAKLVVIGLVLKNYHVGFLDVFAPFFEWMEVFPEPWYRRSFKIIFAICGTALLFNRAVRVNCIIIGSLFLLGTLSSKVYYRNAKVFVGLLLVLTGLQEKGKEPWLIWWQLSLMYLGAGINKLLEVDWQTGQYFDHFLANIYHSDFYLAVKPMLPGLWAAKMLCWSVILLELASGVLFTMRRFRPHAVWLAAAVHIGAALLVAGAYGIYAAALVASYMTCMPWPERLVATVDPNSGWARVQRIFAPLDQDRIIEWRAAPEAGAPPFRLSDGERSWSGWPALGWLCLWTPAVCLVVMVLMTGLPSSWRVGVVRTSAGLGAFVLAWTFLLFVLGRLQRTGPKMTLGTG